MTDPWSMTGQYFEACNCEVACPCVFLSKPTQGVCTVLLGYHIGKGKSGSHPLDGLNFALAVFCRGNMMTNKWEAALYLGQRATEAQRGALQTILGGKAGGVFGVLAPFIAKLHGVRFVPIEFTVDGKKRSLKIPGIAEMWVQTLAGPDGKEVKISNPPFSATPEFAVAKSEKLELTDYGWKWDVSEKTSYVAPFTASGP
jgi:hypothetical protein